MTMRRRARRSIRGARRAAEWGDKLLNFSVGTGGQATQTLLPGIPDDEFKGMTVVRNIIEISAHLSVAGTGGVLFLGIIMMSLEAISAGIFPDADDEQDQPGWLWRTGKSVFTSDSTDHAQGTFFSYDIRSKRKFPSEDHRLVLIADMQSGGNNVNIDGAIRTLVLKS